MAVGLCDIDGIEAARDLMQTHPLPIVLVTSHYDATTWSGPAFRDDGLSRETVAGRRARPAIELAITRFQDYVSLRQENSALKENLEARKLIERAKGLLMDQRNLTEEQAYSLIKRASMNMRKPMADVAQAILLAGGFFTGDKS